MRACFAWGIDRTGSKQAASTTIMGRVERRDSVASSQSDEDEDEEKCPLCCEELDVTDRNFFPCPCGYQVGVIAEGRKRG